MTLDLESILLVLLIILIDPEDGQVSIGIDSADVVRVAVEELDDRLPKVPDSAHLEVEALLSPISVLVEFDSDAAQVARLPRLELMPFEENEALSEVPPEEVILGDELAVLASGVEVGQVVRREELEGLLQRRSDHFLE